VSEADAVTIDVDIGGTFTDCFIRYDGDIATGKAETVESNLSQGFLNAVEATAAELPVSPSELFSRADRIRYSTTAALNKLVSRDGTKLGLLMSEGQEELTFIGRGSQWADGLPVHEQRNVAEAEKPDPIVPPSMTKPVKERMNYDGEIVRPLDEDHLREKVNKLVDRGARGFVVSLAWSFRNPTHEQRVREIIGEEYPDSYLGSAPVFLSSEVNPQRGEYERTMTTILNAYLHRPVVDELLDISDQLRAEGYEKPLMLIHNTGGMAEVYRTSAIEMFSAGPVAALIGASHLGDQYGFDNVIAADMGGTSFDISLVLDGATESYDMDPVIDRWRVNTAMLESKSIGAGGGSIASVDEDLDDRVQVGPESAGSNPGPACYNQGGREPTVTDADLVLGYINPDTFHGGEKRLSVRQAERAIDRNIARPLDIDTVEAAALIRQIVDANMGSQIYTETALRGYDPREFAMFAFGGAGPTHAADVARHANVSTVLTSPFSPVFSAYGSSVMDTVHIYETSLEIPLVHPRTGEYYSDYAQFNGVVSDLREQATHDLRAEGHDPDDVEFRLELDMKYSGLLDITRVRSPHVVVDSEEDISDICEAFEEEFTRSYSPFSDPSESGIFIQNFFLRASVPTPTPSLPTYELRGTDAAHARIDEREVYWTIADGFLDTPIYARSELDPGNELQGPAVIEADNTTVSIIPEATYRVDEHATGWIELD